MAEATGCARPTGAVLGGIVGAAAAREIAKDRTDSEGRQNSATIAGAIGGAMAGNAIQNRMGTGYNLVIRMDDGRPFGVGGIWERWDSESGQPLESCAVITTAANEVVRAVNDRMPVIIPDEHIDAWLDPDNRHVGQLQTLLHPCPAEAITAYRVSRAINRGNVEGEQCIALIEGKA